MKRLWTLAGLVALLSAGTALGQTSADCKDFDGPLKQLVETNVALVDGIEEMLPASVEEEGATGSVDLNALEEELKQILPAAPAVAMTDYAAAVAILLPKLREARDLAKAAAEAVSACAAEAK